MTCRSSAQAAHNSSRLLPIGSKGIRHPNLNTGVTYRCGPFCAKSCSAEIQTCPREGNNKCQRNCTTHPYATPAGGSLPGTTDRQGCKAKVEVSLLCRKMLSGFLFYVDTGAIWQSPPQAQSTKPHMSASPTSFRTLSMLAFGVGTPCWSFSAAARLYNGTTRTGALMALVTRTMLFRLGLTSGAAWTV